MFRPLLLILGLTVLLLASGCDRGSGHAPGASGPYVSGGFGGH